MSAYMVPVDVRFNDIDGMGHVNNAVYLSFLEHARMRFFTERGGAKTEKDIPFILVHAALDYKNPMKMNAEPEITMWTSRVGGKSWDFDYDIKDRTSRVVYATGKTVQVAYDYQLEKSTELEGDLKKLVLALMK